MSRPSISVVTVAKNAAATIRECLRSVAAQSTEPVEHLVVDGASVDGTALLARAEGARVVSEPDRGLYDAMNKGLALASGEVVGFLNADDVYADAEVLVRVASALADGSDACYGDLEYVDAAEPARVTRRWKAGAFDVGRFRWGWMPPHPTFFVRREVYARLGGFDLRFGSAADYELMLRFLVRHRISARYVPAVLVRMRTGGVSNRSLGNRVAANRMDRLAWKENGLSPLPWTTVAKPLRKLGQFLAVATVAAAAARRCEAQIGLPATGVLATAPHKAPNEEQVRSDSHAGRYRLGPVRIRPRLTLGNLGYSNNLTDADGRLRGDWTGSISGGATLSLPLGRFAFVRSNDFVTYNWYLNSADQRRFGGTTSTVLYTFFKRATFEWTGHASSETANLSSEFERPVNQRFLEGSVRGFYVLSSRATLTMSADARRRRYDTGGFSPELQQQLRDLEGGDLAATAGIQYAFSKKLFLGLQYERGSFTFPRAARRDYDSDGVLLSAGYETTRAGVNALVGVRSFHGTTGSTVPDRNGLFGGLSLIYRLRRVGVQLYGRSELVNSLQVETPTFVERRAGAAAFVTLRRFVATGAFEIGANTYDRVLDVRRRDDVTTVRGILTAPLYRTVTLRVDASRSRYTSNLPGFDRTIYQIGSTIGFGSRELIR